ncbi:hypothetical protein HYC85_003612 [Camellia sinensis]|uniref:Uncharacterized protein n=1 Tax=Camellia sinensis TaxID=4442 RepID=A0A7J7HVF5_CAMSI|nr:hypothetical protein HYC85_003612 [Camellia sinensis]
MWLGFVTQLRWNFMHLGAVTAKTWLQSSMKLDATANDVPIDIFDVKGYPTLYVRIGINLPSRNLEKISSRNLEKMSCSEDSCEMKTTPYSGSNDVEWFHAMDTSLRWQGLELLLGLLGSTNLQQQLDGSIALYELANKATTLFPIDAAPPSLTPQTIGEDTGWWCHNVVEDTVWGCHNVVEDTVWWCHNGVEDTGWRCQTDVEDSLWGHVGPL